MLPATEEPLHWVKVSRHQHINCLPLFLDLAMYVTLEGVIDSSWISFIIQGTRNGEIIHTDQ